MNVIKLPQNAGYLGGVTPHRTGDLLEKLAAHLEEVEATIEALKVRRRRLISDYRKEVMRRVKVGAASAVFLLAASYPLSESSFDQASSMASMPSSFSLESEASFDASDQTLSLGGL